MVGRPGPRDPALEVPAALERLGFHAELRDGVVELRGCPCPVVSPGDPRLVCSLCTGVIDGVLAACGTGLQVSGDSHDPVARHCQAPLTRKRG
jgi:hypothetical protein